MHESVLLNETIEGLSLESNSESKIILVDGTLGRGGHSIEAFRKQSDIFVIGIDRDEDALTESRKKFEALGKKEHIDFELFLGNFSDMDKFVKPILQTTFQKEGKTSVDAIILDLGLSSPQIDSSGRGISFKNDEPLLMTMEKEVKEGSFTAQDIVNGWKEEDIANVIYAYGDERYARRIARGIVEVRETDPIKTTSQLVQVIEKSVPYMYRKGKIHPATRTFQALRIAVNDELGSLKKGLLVAESMLKPKGRLAIISFHSLEDRIAKTMIKEWQTKDLGMQSTKKPIEPGSEEVKRNPRSRSAKLRIFIKN